MHGLGKILGIHPHHPHEHHGLLHHIHHHRPKKIIQNINVNVYEQPKVQYKNKDYNQQPYYENEGTNQGNENRPMSTDEFFALQKQIKEEQSREYWENLKKKDKKENNTEKEKKEKEMENNYPLQPLKNPNQDSQYNQGFEPAPPSNQNPGTGLLPTLMDMI